MHARSSYGVSGGQLSRSSVCHGQNHSSVGGCPVYFSVPAVFDQNTSSAGRPVEPKCKRTHGVQVEEFTSLYHAESQPSHTHHHQVNAEGGLPEIQCQHSGKLPGNPRGFGTSPPVPIYSAQNAYQEGCGLGIQQGHRIYPWLPCGYPFPISDCRLDSNPSPM